jgi:predicted phage terminase large subunit-like protein
MKFCVEDQASGIPLVQELRRSTSIPIIGVQVDASKYVRAESVTPEFESGRVYLPEGASWLDGWIEEHIRFPSGAHDDFVDTTSGALGQMRARGVPFSFAISHANGSGE